MKVFTKQWQDKTRLGDYVIRRRPLGAQNVHNDFLCCEDWMRILRGLEPAPVVVEGTPIIHILSCSTSLPLFNVSNVLII